MPSEQRDLVEEHCLGSCQCHTKPKVDTRCPRCGRFVLACPNLRENLRTCRLLEGAESQDNRRRFLDPRAARCNSTDLVYELAKKRAGKENPRELANEALLSWLENPPKKLDPQLTSQIGGFRGYIWNGLYFAKKRLERRRSSSEQGLGSVQKDTLTESNMAFLRVRDRDPMFLRRARRLLSQLLDKDARAHAAILGRIEERSDKEIADVLGVARETVSRARRRGLKFLKTSLREPHRS